MMHLLALLGLLDNVKHHGGENAQLGTINEVHSSILERNGDLLGISGQDLELLKQTSTLGSEVAAPLGGTENGENITERLHVLPLAGERVVPGDLIANISQILLVLNLETNILERLLGHLTGVHLGDTITNLDTVGNLTVTGVGLVVLVSQHPLVDTKGSTGLENTVDLAVNTLQNRGVDSGLDRVNGIKGLIGKVHLHKVTLNVGKLIIKLLHLGVVVSLLDLVVIVVKTNNVNISKAADLTTGTTNTTANIKDLHASLEAHLVSKVVLMSGSGLLKVLALVVTREMERGAPTVLVKVGSEVVVVLGKGRVVLKSGLLILLGLGLGVLVIPVLEVTINGSKMRLLVLASEGGETGLASVRRTMHGIGKVGIGLEVLGGKFSSHYEDFVEKT